MDSLVQVLAHALRYSRAPLAAGALVVMAVWIQISDEIAARWATSDFGAQLASVSGLLQGVGVATLALLATGVAGSVSIRAFRLFVEPVMRRLLSLWTRVRYRKEIRTYYREPQWPERISAWATMEIFSEFAPDRPTETFWEMRSRISRDPEFRRLSRDLERDLRGNPSAPFIGDDQAGLVQRLDALQFEDDFRVAVVPALMALIVSVGVSGWSWTLGSIPLLVLVYGSSLSKRDDTTLLALTWLLDGNGTCHGVEVLRLWTHDQSQQLRANGPSG